MPTAILKPVHEVALLLTMKPARTERGAAVQALVLARVESHIEASKTFRAQAPQWIAEALKGE